MDEDYKALPGCPFCPSLDFLHKRESFNLVEFNDHVKSAHFEKDGLSCPYCCKVIRPMDISFLTSHIMLDHCIHWRPSPLSLSYMRQDVIISREIYCLGCGQAFTSTDHNLATPPGALIDHMNAGCTGGTVALEPLPLLDSEKRNGFQKPILRALNLRAKSISWDFAERYPFSRGYTSRPKNLQTKLEEIDKYNADQKKKPHKAVKTKCDVSLALPPSPPLGRKKKSSETCRVYVCPVCGENSLPSLRARDEHLANDHNGENVFACQICGKAYPLYIALRRHAAKDHKEDYDGCLYGLGNTESDEIPQTFDCLKCNLVSFTKQNVLKKHIRHMHPGESIPGLGRGKGRGRKSADEYNEDGDWSHPSMGNASSNPGRGRGRGRPPGSRTKKDSSSDEVGEPPAKIQKSSAIGFFASELELKMKLVPPEEKTSFCHDCQRQFHNQRELLLHIEIEHSDVECNQLGCQACGRIFFGPDQKMDLIGHLKIVHNSLTTDANVSSNFVQAVECSNTDCEAVFYSARLRKLHICPMKNILERCHNLLNIPQEVVDGTVEGTIDMLTLPDELHHNCDPRVLATEIAADEAGTFVLAYGCPQCNYIFTGNESTERFLEHRKAGDCSI
ncbi:hypothetical protein Ciccas_003281 [Cichlidogyrus casuarinus]|uniref:C2H2-type domain-containing protein n=1 Tax=Cichlidogyrus casuarinus TaxID=1844966 RepID=A0ABD2QFS5_9PLAT